MNVADALLAYENAKAARKQQLCGLLPGGADAYNYLPERCARKANRVNRSSRTSRSTNFSQSSQSSQPSATSSSTSQFGLSSGSLQDLKRLTADLIRSLKEKDEQDILSRIQNLSQNETTSRHLPAPLKIAITTMQNVMVEMPEFMAFAISKFTAANLIVSHPDHEERWREVCKLWKGKIKFLNRKRVKASVFAVACSQLE